MLTEMTVEELKNLMVSAGESAVKRIKRERNQRKMIVDAGKFFTDYEACGNRIDEDIAEILSRKNMEKLAKDIKDETGYKIKDKILKFLINLMAEYEIPNETACFYAQGIMDVILEQIRESMPEEYDRYYWTQLKEGQEKAVTEICSKIESNNKKLTTYRERQEKIYSADEMITWLERTTASPQIGIDFFKIDDEEFKKLFSEYRLRECIYVRARCIEEAIYCIINELYTISDNRTVLVVRNKDGWEELRRIQASGNIYIPWFYADEIVAISGNTNIFIHTDDLLGVSKDVIELRPRTHSTLEECLRNAGLEAGAAGALVAETHGLYIPMKKKIIKGAYLKKPEWLTGLPEEIKKVCLLVGQWTESEGDKAVIETLSGLRYDEFVKIILPYTRGEDPIVYVVKRREKKTYYLACVENTWDYMNISVNEPVWDKFIRIFTEVLNESEKLFTYSVEEEMIARIRGEKLFWSQEIRSGMLRSLIMKVCYRKDEECQYAIDKLVQEILGYVKKVEQWKYISSFFSDLCEISPREIIKRLNKELTNPTGLVELFKKQSGNLLFDRNDCVRILWGVEELLVQREFAVEALKWLLRLDNMVYEYKAGSLGDSIGKVFFPWYNFSAFQTVQEKVFAAELAFEYDQNTWDYIYGILPWSYGSICGQLHWPKYRDHECVMAVSGDESKEVVLSYVEMLIKHTEFKTERWIKFIKITKEMPEELRDRVFREMLYEISQMSDREIIQVKDAIRDIIFQHRYFSSASWAMPEEKIMLYEELLSEINTVQPEYEYEYLFRRNGRYPVLYPVPYDHKKERDENERNAQKLISEKLKEFQERNLDLKTLVDICGHDESTTLGRNLALYWKNAKYDRDTFVILINLQNSGRMALDYYEEFVLKKEIPFEDVIETVKMLGCSDEFIAGLYFVEACHATGVPQVSNAENSIKKIFWANQWIDIGEHYEWTLSECKKFGTISSFLQLLYRAYKRYNLSNDEIYCYLQGIREMNPGTDISGIQLYLLELLKPLQKEYFENSNRCMKIAEIELYFSDVISWENMKCFQREIKKSPDLFAEMISILYRKEDTESKVRELTEEEQHYIKGIYNLFDKAKFCPAEINGEVEEDQLRKWIERLELLLKKNKQSSLLSSLLGRVFAYSPVGKDKHMPCEAVRKMIEIYADDGLISEYQVSTFNERGMHGFSAGKEELQIAEKFKDNADYLNMKYPRTAEIYYGLYHNYKADAVSERERAENGWS